MAIKLSGSKKAQVEVLGLPGVIMSDIFSRLPLEDIIRCSAVSTNWYQITKGLYSDPLHTDQLHGTQSEIMDILLYKRRPHAGLSYVVEVDGSLHMMSSNSRRIDGKSKHVEIPHGKKLSGSIMGSCNGLLLIADTKGLPYAIYNPITKDTMILPKLELPPNCQIGHPLSCALGFDPINMNYKVAVAYEYCGKSTRFSWKATGDIITLGESSWRRLQFPEVNIHIDAFKPAVFFNGSFHWVNGTQHDVFRSKYAYQLNGILALDINSEKFNLTKFSASMDLDVSCVHVFNTGNSLALVGDRMGPSWCREKKPGTIQIWKILGTKADGSCLYKYMTLNVGVKLGPLVTDRGYLTPLDALGDQGYLTPLGALGNDKFLFKVSSHLLFLYDTEKDEGFIIDVPAEVPKVWDAIIFQPSLSIFLKDSH